MLAEAEINNEEKGTIKRNENVVSHKVLCHVNVQLLKTYALNRLAYRVI